MGPLQGKKAKTQHTKGKKNGTTSGKKNGIKGTTSRKKKKKQQKQTKPNIDKGATTAGPLRTKRKPINK
jgi:hypothetical protein